MDRSYGSPAHGRTEGAHDRDRLWENLAVVTSADPAAAGAVFAERINGARNPTLVTLPLANALFGIVAASTADGPGGAHAMRLSDIVLRVKPACLAAALRVESDGGARQNFLRDASLVLAAPALARVAHAATAAWDRPVSAALRELVRKLARATTAPTEQGAAADAVLRETVAHRLDVASTNGAALVRDLRFMRSAKPVRRVAGRVTPEADRLVYMALETGALGEVVWLAVNEMVEQGRIRELLDAVKHAPDTAAGSAVMERIASTTTLNVILQEDPVDVEALDLVLQPLGLAAAKPLLERLAESRVRTTRRVVLERLAALGPEIAPLVETRLRDSRWFVVRNMLHLLREAGCTETVRFAQRFMQHTDARVRREALQLLLLSPTAADEALVAGIRDTDKGVLRIALQAARGRLPEAAVPILAQRLVEDIGFPPEFRVISIRILSRSSSALALDALLTYVQGGRSLLGRPRLSQKSPEMVAALSGLARSWRQDRRVRALIDVAARSRDPQIAAAVRDHAEGDDS